MRVGLVGVGRMGQGMLHRWQASGHKVVAYDKAGGADLVGSLKELVVKLEPPRIVWLMVPSKARHEDDKSPVEQNIKELQDLLETGDIVIDGGNSFFEDTQARAQELDKLGISLIDIGVSGGLAGEEEGYALMVGGEKEVIDKIDELLKALAINKNYAYVGEVGAGHFVKMVHNAIEYGMMQAIGEGFDLLKNGPVENLDLAQIANNWREGTIVRSYLMDLTASALSKNENVESIAAHVDDSGEGRWSVDAAVKSKVPFWVNTAALYARFDSRQQDNFSHKLIAALRQEFGGHATKKSP